MSKNKDSQIFIPLSIVGKKFSIYDNFNMKQFCRYFGPGLLISIAYLDPGNLQGDIDAARSAKYSLLWVLALSTYVGYLFQMLASTLGTVTGYGLSDICRKMFPKRVSNTLWIMAEIAIIGADIQEIIGTSVALNILFGIPLWVGAVITVVDTFIILLVQYYEFEKLESIFGLLILIMASMFFINLLKIQPNASDIFEGLFIPSIPDGSKVALVSLIGGIIMPHNLYLHSSVVLTREINRENELSVQSSIQYYNLESFIALASTLFINICVISTFASFPSNFGDISLQTAGNALSQQFGDSGKYIWGIGLLAAGQSSTMAGTLAGQYIMEGFIKIKINKFYRSLLTRSIAIIPSLIVTIIGNPEDLNSSINILQAIQLPFAVIPLLKFSRNKSLMGDYVVKDFLYYFLILVACLMTALNVITLSYNIDWNQQNSLTYIFPLCLVIYFGFIIFLLRQNPELQQNMKLKHSFSKYLESDDNDDKNQKNISQDFI